MEAQLATKPGRIQETQEMTENCIIIPLPLITLNDYIALERNPRVGYRMAAAKKKQCTKVCKNATLRAMERGVRFDFPCALRFDWVVKNARTDPDNIAFQKKFILDGLQEAEFLQLDSLKFILGFEDSFRVAEKDEEPHVVLSEVVSNEQ